MTHSLYGACKLNLSTRYGIDLGAGGRLEKKTLVGDPGVDFRIHGHSKVLGENPPLEGIGQASLSLVKGGG